MRLSLNVLTRYPLHWAAALALVFLFSCKKEKASCTGCPPTGVNCEDIQNVKKFFAFKVGSWWLYEEENSGARDSVYVTQYANDPNNYNFDVRMYSTYQDYFYHFWPIFASGSQSCNESGSTCSSCVQIKRSKYKPGDFVEESRCFFFVYNVGEFKYVYNTIFPNNAISVEYEFETYSIGSNIFQRTVKIHELNTFMEGKQPTNHYFSEDVGLIRKELLDSNQIWNLIDYYIQE